jgi:hypothetical protein
MVLKYMGLGCARRCSHDPEITRSVDGGCVRYLTPLSLLLSVDAVPVVLVGISDRLLVFAPAVVGRRAPLQLGDPFARGTRCIGSGLAFRRAGVACHRLV